jgi:hypothetical protein
MKDIKLYISKDDNWFHRIHYQGKVWVYRPIKRWERELIVIDQDNYMDHFTIQDEIGMILHQDLIESFKTHLKRLG